MFSSYSYLYCLLLLAAKNYKLVFGQGSNFTMNANSYNCSTNLLCYGSAHSALESSDGNKTFAGRLSLIYEEPDRSASNAGLAYYNSPVRMLDHSSGRSASFNTSFAINEVMESYVNPDLRSTGDGMAFVISANRSALGSTGKFLGIFGADGTTSYNCIVVEFDIYQNQEAPALDISNNHVSFDFHNITWVAAANASDVNVLLWYNLTTYAWVEYSAETQLLQLRISNKKTRPIKPLLSYKVNLFDVVDEYMWVGFSAGSGDTWNHYYVGNWTFESYGIPVADPPGHVHKAQSKVGMIVGISVGVPALLVMAIAGVFILVFVRRRRRLRSVPDGPGEDPVLKMSGMPERISYKDLSVATGSFGDDFKLGQGGFGSVYRGVLPSSGTPVAVKKISGDSNQGEKEFMAEVSIISQLRHRNLIQLLGWCKSKGKYLLVYELMPNGSLDKALFLPNEVPVTALSWSQRFNIVSGTAAALDYLHRGWKQRVIHRDIKTSNIMLDNEWNAKLGDFGLARLVDHLITAPTTAVVGTYGYIAPEAASGKFTEKTDVFAFGAVALEIACGRKAFQVHGLSEEIVLVDWVWQRLSEGDLLSVVDRRLDDYDRYWMEVVLLTGLLCSHPDASARPSMRRVVQVLAGEAAVPAVSASKPTMVFHTDSPTLTISDLQNSNTRNTTTSGTSLTMTLDLAR